jgi:hypothetical protein
MLASLHDCRAASIHKIKCPCQFQPERGVSGLGHGRAQGGQRNNSTAHIRVLYFTSRKGQATERESEGVQLLYPEQSRRELETEQRGGGFCSCAFYNPSMMKKEGLCQMPKVEYCAATCH